MSIELLMLETIDKNIENAYNAIQIAYATV
jgi:hypothetical protein